MRWLQRFFGRRPSPVSIVSGQPAPELTFDDLDPATKAQSRAWNAAMVFAEACARLGNGEPDGVPVELDDLMNTLMTELWDQGFSQTEIRKAFQNALADMPRYAAGHERRP